MGGKRKPKGEPRSESPSPAEQQPPPTPRASAEFKRGYRLQARRGKDMAKRDAVMAMLAERRPLEPRHRDHALAGDWSGYRECHVEPDSLLVYQATDSELKLARTGTHSDLGF